MKLIFSLLSLGILLIGLSTKAAPALNTTAPYVMDAGVGIMVGGGSALPGVNVAIVKNVASTPVYAGINLGVFLDASSPSSAAIIPILGTVLTEIRASEGVFPRLGVSAGPTLATGGGYSTARFALLLDPAIRFDLGSRVDLIAQASFGVIGGAFLAIPRLGIVLPI